MRSFSHTRELLTNCFRTEGIELALRILKVTTGEIRNGQFRPSAAHRKPVHKITDRAKRYRANADGVRPRWPKRCGFCGSKRNVGVHHVNGKEDDGARGNLMWACKSCNGKIAHKMKRARIGTRTRQYNPRHGSRSSQMAAYGAAIKVMRGEFKGDVAKAVATIRSTPPEVRSAYTARTWPTRRAIYGESGRQSEIPF